MEYMMANLSVPSPFKEMDDGWYQLRSADHPEYQLMAVKECHRWVAVVRNLSINTECVNRTHYNTTVLPFRINTLDALSWDASRSTTKRKQSDERLQDTGSDVTEPVSTRAQGGKNSSSVSNNTWESILSITSEVRETESVTDTTQDDAFQRGIPDAATHLFSFKPVEGRYGAVHYSLSIFEDSMQEHLCIPCPLCSNGQTPPPSFRSEIKNIAKFNVVQLPDGEVALVQKLRRGLRFLHWSPGGKDYLKTSYQYPGRDAHWQVLRERPEKRS